MNILKSLALSESEMPWPWRVADWMTIGYTENQSGIQILWTNYRPEAVPAGQLLCAQRQYPMSRRNS